MLTLNTSMQVMYQDFNENDRIVVIKSFNGLKCDDTLEVNEVTRHEEKITAIVATNELDEQAVYTIEAENFSKIELLQEEEEGWDDSEFERDFEEEYKEHDIILTKPEYLDTSILEFIPRSLGAVIDRTNYISQTKKKIYIKPCILCPPSHHSLTTCGICYTPGIYNVKMEFIKAREGQELNSEITRKIKQGTDFKIDAIIVTEGGSLIRGHTADEDD